MLITKLRGKSGLYMNEEKREIKKVGGGGIKATKDIAKSTTNI